MPTFFKSCIPRAPLLVIIEAQVASTENRSCAGIIQVQTVLRANAGLTKPQSRKPQ